MRGVVISRYISKMTKMCGDGAFTFTSSVERARAQHGRG